MAGIVVSGVVQRIPKAYNETKIVTNTGTAIPEFNVAALLGEVEKGTPYNFVSGSLKKDVEAARPVFREYGSSSDVERDFGVDSQLATAFRYAKTHGLTRCYVAAVTALTRANANLTSAGPVNQITVFPKSFGAPQNWISLTLTTGANGGRKVTITPVKTYVFLNANVSSGDTIYEVKSIGRFRVGQIWKIAANDATTPETVTIKTITEGFNTATGQKKYTIEIEETGNVGAYSTVKDGLLFQEDTNAAVTSPELLTNQAIVDWLNSDVQSYIGAELHPIDEDGTLPTAFLKTYIIAIAGATDGQSPAMVTGDWTSFFTLMDTELANFEGDEKRQMRLFGMVTGAHADHLQLRSFLIARRALGKEMAGICGTAWGDIDLDAVGFGDPTEAAADLNDQDTQLAVAGGDYLDGYLTHGPAFFGIRVGNSPAHNATRDKILFSTLEKRWDQNGSGEIDKLLRFGCSVIDRDKEGFHIVQYINTLQANENVWNADTTDTAFPMQRDLADLAKRTLLEALDRDQVGADNITGSSLAVFMKGVIDTLIENKYVEKGTKVTAIRRNSTANGYDIAWDAKLPQQNDYFKVITSIIVGEALAA